MILTVNSDGFLIHEGDSLLRVAQYQGLSRDQGSTNQRQSSFSPMALQFTFLAYFPVLRKVSSKGHAEFAVPIAVTIKNSILWVTAL
jgi:hypothetical protein